jgi:ubiquinone biosynthesis monooxygenase Coq7
MEAQEEDHRACFDKLVNERGARPTVLQPVWHVAGFALGAATALIGPEAAMACTAAIETEIDRHYTQQLDELGEEDPELAALITRARDERARAPRYRAGRRGRAGARLSAAFRAIRLGCRLAIKLSERI